MSTTLTLNDSGDMLKYLDRGERIVARVLPRPVPFFCSDDPAAPPETLREFRRLTDNLCRLVEWAESLPHENRQAEYHRIDGHFMIVEPGAGAPIAAQWAYLEQRLIYAAEHAADSVGDAEAAACWMREARYYLKRMRVLVCRGQQYSSLLSFDELAAVLREDGILL